MENQLALPFLKKWGSKKSQSLLSQKSQEVSATPRCRLDSPSSPCSLLSELHCYFYQLSPTQLLLHVSMANGVTIPAEARESQRDLSSVTSRTDEMSCASLGGGVRTFYRRSNKNIADI